MCVCVQLPYCLYVYIFHNNVHTVVSSSGSDTDQQNFDYPSSPEDITDLVGPKVILK